MNPMDLELLLRRLAQGELSVPQALDSIRAIPFSENEIAKLDNFRSLRNGMPEVIFCQGKRSDHLLRIIEEYRSRRQNLLCSRMAEDVAVEVCKRFSDARYDSASRVCEFLFNAVPQLPGLVAVLSAGTADIPVAEEARKTLSFFGIESIAHYDVGIAGLHRLLSKLDDIRRADAVIAIAGMEGALPSVLGGLIKAPIIAVPTSIGYGANFGGIAALLAMLNSCSEGISVVNIDNGFGAACAARRILQLKDR